MLQFTVEQWWRKIDDWRVRNHFRYVEIVLRNRDASHLSPRLRVQRECYIDQLHGYAERGIYPRNHERQFENPCFIDRDGRECAVANLVMFSGKTDLVNDIAVTANYAYVQEMNFPELDNWAGQTGLTKEELALIQPGYYYTFSGVLLWASVTTSTMPVTKN